MKAPIPSNYYIDSRCNNESSFENTNPEKSLTTAALMKFIGDTTMKRRIIRRKTRCGNLLAEALLSNALREAKKELAKKQEEKRKNLQNFTYSVTINYTPMDSSNSDSNHVVVDFNSKDSVVQSCLSSLDSFFNELKEIKT